MISWSRRCVYKTASRTFRCDPNTTSSRHLTAQALQFETFGNPLDVVKKTEISLPDEASSGCALVKMLASPVNPSDINTVEGVYPIKPMGFPPGTGGNEGVGEVVAVGDNVVGLSVGDWVVPAIAGLWGTWSSHVMQPVENLFKIPNDIPVLAAATLAVNPCSAYRMMCDFVSLTPGDVIIQNGANSAVGQAAIQIAREMGVKTLNVVRDRKDLDAVTEFLKELGADEVVTDSSIREANFRERIISEALEPVLALNCVGGKPASDLMRLMKTGGTMVTYGAMSKQPFAVPATALIFKDLRIRGFWMSEWNKRNRERNDESRKMMEFLCDLIRRGKFVTPKLSQVNFEDFEEGLRQATTPFITEKQVFVF